MLHTVHSNVLDSYTGADIFTAPVARSVTVFAIGAPETIAEAATLERLRARAVELLGADAEAEATRTFAANAIGTGEPFGVEIDGRDPHRVRVVDGPLEGEAVLALRLLGTRSWA
ncbi:hypothetical protein LEUCIP111803_00915 [Leucobacter soli]|uniref:Uncharacterized protein n=1 Tax=Leucobacter soli TaxID=2812850 RepID=A0A916JV61_9MICO|nr:hypothetical protein [Leucobacter soli]CAG7606334.1 hypothetical protein LEUCIP111803_00915 [Leucobacter soli]